MKKGAVPKVQLAVVELVETTIFSAMVITYWSSPFILFNKNFYLTVTISRVISFKLAAPHIAIVSFNSPAIFSM